MDNLFTVTRDLLQRTKDELERLEDCWDVGTDTYILYHQIDHILRGPDPAYATGGQTMETHT